MLVGRGLSLFVRIEQRLAIDAGGLGSVLRFGGAGVKRRGFQMPYGSSGRGGCHYERNGSFYRGSAIHGSGLGVLSPPVVPRVFRVGLSLASAACYLHSHKNGSVHCDDGGVVSAYTAALTYSSIISDDSKNEPEAVVGVADDGSLALTRVLKKAWGYFLTTLSSVYRTVQLAFIFSPLLIASPLLLWDSTSASYQSVWWETLKNSIKRAGPCFTKFAQWTATRPDLFPERLCRELETLQSAATVHSWEDTERAIVNSFGAETLRDLEVKGNDDLVGSGSAAQVYHGKYQGRDVAIKVLHPGIRAQMDADVEIMRLAIDTFELIPGVEAFSLREMVDEFADLLQKQLDMKAEANALVRFTNNFVDPKWRPIIAFPKPVNDLVSEDVLIETYESGVSVTQFMLDAPPEVKSDLADMCIRMILKMLFEDNFVHGDLHGGNILVRLRAPDGSLKENGAPKTNSGSSVSSISGSSGSVGLVPEVKSLAPSSWLQRMVNRLHGSDGDKILVADAIHASWRPQLVILDAGIANTMTSVHRRNFIDTFYSFITKDGESLSRDMITRSRDPQRCKDPAGFSREMQLLINDIHRTGIDPTALSISQLMRRVFGLCYKYQVKLESSYAGVLIAVSIMEGLIRQLDPSLDILARATPYIFRAALKG